MGGGATPMGGARDTIPASSNRNHFSKQHSSSWLNYNVENRVKMLYIKEYKSSPIDIELSYITKVRTEID